MSGVRNLRAMFEQKGETSPPAPDDRGRSPGPGSTGTESPRPLSRVKTSFIAVEKDGRIGLTRDTSRDSSISTRKLSGDLETPSLSRTVSQDNTNPSGDNTTERTPLRRTSLKGQPIPESPRTDSVAQMPSLPPKTVNGKAQAPPLNPDKTVDIEEPSTKMAVGGPTDKSAVTGNGSSESLKGTGGEKDKAKGKTVAKEASKSTATGNKAAAAKTLAPVNTSNKAATKSAKSPTVSKPQKSPATATAPKLSAKTPERNATHPEKTATPRAATTTAKTAASASGPSSVKKPPPLQSSPASTGFVKPKVKSPTRPVKLPPGLTTHTAASATKFNVPRQSLSRNGHTAEDQGRPRSRASVSTTATRTTTTTTGKNLKRQSSTISRPRPSIGPPPKQPSKDHPPTKKETHVDESFLARMMRPTAASASKTHEKGPVTPPRKTAPAPTVKKAAPKQDEKHEKPVTKSVTKSVEKPVAKTVAKPAQPAAASSSHAEQPSSAKDVAPVVEKAATAEEAIKAARDIDGPAALPEETAHHEPSVKEIAPVVEQLESAEEIIEAAKDVEGEMAPPAEPETKEADAAAEQEDAPTEQEAHEEAPSEATLVNGGNDKPTALEAALEEAEHAREVVKAEEEKAEEDTSAKQEVAV